MTLRVLSVAYPFAPVRPDTAGGAEQVLRMLDAALVAGGHRSAVLAARGSRVVGELVKGPWVDGVLTDAGRVVMHEAWSALLCRTLARDTFDVVHMHGLDFHAYLPPPGPPVLATLHLPLAFYPADALSPERPRTFLNTVSASQGDGFDLSRRLPHLLPPIENGVEIPPLAAPVAKGDYALMLTRICPEKGVHLALDAAKQAGMPLLIAGDTFPYEAHQRYLKEEVLPRLDDVRRLIGSVGDARKAELLRRARCLIVASTVAETSSLAAREALAAGTPVVAFARGALPDAIDHGQTGFLVETVAEMAAMMGEVGRLDPVRCHAVARERFAATSMAARYFALYRQLATGAVG